jgi:hypothetical protein
MLLLSTPGRASGESESLQLELVQYGVTDWTDFPAFEDPMNLQLSTGCGRWKKFFPTIGTFHLRMIN